MLKIVRLDERLIHGQIVTSWCTGEHITEIMVVDKDVCNNEMRQSLMSMAVPDGISLIFTDVDGCVQQFDEECKYEDLMILFSNPNDILEFLNKGGHFDKVNIGGMSSKGRRKKICTSVYADENEVEVLKKIAGKNVQLEAKMLPTDKGLDVSKLI
jgi:mannose/fructose/N-acetylgalactosamine-specific phosphotransferase system component IIB